MRVWAICLTFFVLAACSAPHVVYLSKDIPADASLHQVYVAKSGALGQDRSLFRAGREPGMQFALATVSIPAIQQPGQVLWPGSNRPQPDRHFVLSDVTAIANAKAFEAAIPTSAENERVLLVHGFNMTPGKAIFSAAQIHKDFGLTSPIVAFSWPSAGRPRGYLHDRDSVLFARSDLVATLQLLTKTPGKRLSIVGHSMGSALIMEALRELAIRGDSGTLSRISSVLLVAPDVDPEVFRRQAQEIGDLPQPFVVFVARNDRALELASFFSFERRLGAIQSIDDIGDLDVTLIDLTSLGDGQGLNHEIALTSPAAIQLLKGVREGDPVAQQALEQYLVQPALPVILTE